MQNLTLLITIRGPFQTLDLELPGDVPISELLPLLLEIVSFQSKDPQALSQANAYLYVAGMYTPLPSDATLINAGIGNGTELELRTQEWHQTLPSNIQSQQFRGRSVQQGIGTGGVGVTWVSLR